MNRVRRLISIVAAILLGSAILLVGIQRYRGDIGRGDQSRLSAKVLAESKASKVARAEDLRGKRQLLVEKLNLILTRPAVAGPNFVTRGRKTGVWRWSLDEYDAALVMSPNDYVQPTSSDDGVLCNYFSPIILNFDLKGSGFKQLIIAFPHFNISCDVDQVVLRDNARRLRLRNFEEEKMTELGVNPSETQWEEGSASILGDHEIVVLGMKTTTTNDNYRLISVIYWWQLDTDSGDARQLAAYDPR